MTWRFWWAWRLRRTWGLGRTWRLRRTWRLGRTWRLRRTRRLGCKTVKNKGRSVCIASPALDPLGLGAGREPGRSRYCHSIYTLTGKSEKSGASALYLACGGRCPVAAAYLHIEVLFLKIARCKAVFHTYRKTAAALSLTVVCVLVGHGYHSFLIFINFRTVHYMPQPSFLAHFTKQ